MDRALVTGGAGFLGSHLVRALVQDRKVVVLDDLSRGRRGNLAHLPPDRVSFLRGDIRNLEPLRTAMKGTDIIFHLAALTSVPDSLRTPLVYQEVNVKATLNVLTEALRAGVGRVVFSSSAAVYGPNPSNPKRETMLPEPASPYAASKVAGEAYCRAYDQRGPLRTVILRFFNVYGPGQQANTGYASVVPTFFRCMTRGERPVIYGDGRQTRDFIYVEDAVHGLLLAAEREAAAGKVINIGTGKATSVLHLARGFNAVLGTALAPLHAPSRPGDLRHSLADISLARRVLGFRPLVGLTEGIQRVAGEDGRLRRPGGER